jgi:hypothetical protein
MECFLIPTNSSGNYTYLQLGNQQNCILYSGFFMILNVNRDYVLHED